METKPFEVGKQYKRIDGTVVTCVAINQDNNRFHAACFDDFPTKGWRYNGNDGRRGQMTGCKPDDYRTVIPNPLPSLEEAIKLLKNILETYKFEDGAPVMQEAAAFVKRTEG